MWTTNCHIPITLSEALTVVSLSSRVKPVGVNLTALKAEFIHDWRVCEEFDRSPDTTPLILSNIIQLLLS